MTLTPENYYSKEASTEYMDATQFKKFAKCEAAALAEFRGEYSEEMTTSLLVGSYVDAYFDGTLSLFKAKHPEIINSHSGELKADFKQAEYIIRRIEQDEYFMWAISGEKQVVVTGEIASVPFRGKMDFLHPDEAIVDLKIMRDFEPQWIPNAGKVPYWVAWGYHIQGAIYQCLEGNSLPFLIAAASKEKETNIEVRQISQENLNTALKYVERLASHYNDLKHGIGKPWRCEQCDYCKKTKKLDGAICDENVYEYVPMR